MAIPSGFDPHLRHEIVENMYQLLNETVQFYEIVHNLIMEGKSRLVLSISAFDKLSPQFSFLVIENPLFYLSACEEGYQKVFESVFTSSASYGKRSIPFTPRLGVKAWLGSHTVTPRGLSARLVNRLVCIEGIVTRCSLVRPKLIRSVHVSEGTEKSRASIIRDHFDYSSLQKDQQLMTRGIPKTDKEGNPFTMELGLCSFRDSQMVTLQEMPEAAPTGQLPRSVDVVLQDDLADSVKPGDRVRMWGIYRAMIWKDSCRVTTGISKTILLANNVEQLKQDILTPELSPTDIHIIREIASRPDTFELLSQSIAPSICGHHFVKKGLLLQMFGGERKQLENGMKLRGDIHILLIGDPSCGKSQLLRFILNTAPLALSTTGRGSSGVGLTAAVTADKDSHERRLEAGAMVLGDGGLVCIDEFDKMNVEDRVSIHEVMEQQTVTINKAGIHMCLNARTTILAAANPVYGSFDPSTPFKTQISFPDSLLTRFDLIYIIRDSQTDEEDRRICSQVIRQLQTSTEQDIEMLMSQERSDDTWGILQPIVSHTEKGSESLPRVWEKSVIPSSTVSNTPQLQTVVSVNFLQKYLYYAKHARPCPILGEDAINSIVKFYTNLRQSFTRASSMNRSHVIPTTRTLEACVRLATAHAKLKLKATIDEEDANAAQLLLLYTLTGELPEGYNSMGVLCEEPLPALLPVSKRQRKQSERKSKETSRKTKKKKYEPHNGFVNSWDRSTN